MLVKKSLASILGVCAESGRVQLERILMGFKNSQLVKKKPAVQS